jgi:hypothetical protein
MTRAPGLALAAILLGAMAACTPAGLPAGDGDGMVGNFPVNEDGPEDRDAAVEVDPLIE